MHKNRNIARLLALALLIAQFGAEAHAYSHLTTNPHGVPGSLQSCATCLSFTPVTMAVGGTPCVVLTYRCEAEPALPAATVSIADHLPFRAFQPRAPPQLL